MDGYVIIEDVKAVGQSDKALHVVLPGGDMRWIPQSAIGPDSEVWCMPQRGRIQLAEWKAAELGLAEDDEPPKRPLPMKAGTAAASQRTARMIVVIIRGKAAQRRAGAMNEPDAICECGRCDGDPIAWHQAESLESIADEIEKAMGGAS